MKTKALLLGLSLSFTPCALALDVDLVLDLENLAQALLQVEAAQKLLDQLGDPAKTKNLPGALAALQGLGITGVGEALLDIQLTTTGTYGQSYDSYGLYEPVDPEIPLADGTTQPRSVERYRKFEAVQRAKDSLDEVALDTATRREQLRFAQSMTVQAIQAAPTDAAVQKLRGIQAAQASELATVSAEQTEALARVLVQQAANEEDRARQREAQLERRAASLQSALQDASRFFEPDSKPSLLPAPSVASQSP